MSTETEILPAVSARGTPADFELIFHTHYQRVARILARVLGDSARAEELAVEVFFKLWQRPQVRGQRVGGWLYRTAVRKGLDELRQRTRRNRYERLSETSRMTAAGPSPEEIHAAGEREERVRAVLTAIPRRHAELLVLQSHGLSYEEIAAGLRLSPASVSKLLRRAQANFRREYLRRYGPLQRLAN